MKQRITKAVVKAADVKAAKGGVVRAKVVTPNSELPGVVSRRLDKVKRWLKGTG